MPRYRPQLAFSSGIAVIWTARAKFVQFCTNPDPPLDDTFPASGADRLVARLCDVKKRMPRYTPAMSERAASRLIVVGLLILAAGIFLTGINWGLPSRRAAPFLFG